MVIFSSLTKESSLVFLGILLKILSLERQKYKSLKDSLFKLNKSKKLIPEKKNNLVVRTQDLGKRYHDTGTFGMLNFNSLINNKNLKFTGFLISRSKGIDIDTTEDWKLAENLFKLKNKFYAVTLGEKGVMWIENHQVYLCKPLKIKVVETNGAGDVFHGAFAYSVDQNNDISHAIKFATAAATLKCTKKGGTRTLPSLSSVNKLAAKLKIIKVHTYI